MATDLAKQAGRRRRKEAPRKGDLREAAILDAAEALLDRDGVESVTVEEIAKGAGISRGALYFYFGSKQEVVTALVGRTMEVLIETAVLPTRESEIEPMQAIERAVTRTEKQWKEHGVVMRAAVDYTPFIPEVSQLWKGTVEKYIDSLTPVMVRAGLPDSKGPDGARALTTALCWGTERNFYIASNGSGTLRAARERSLVLWRRAINL